MTIKKYLKLCFVVLGFASTTYANVCQEKLIIEHMPIAFGKQRISLTQAYQKEHYGIKTTNIQIDPKFIVLHWTSTHSLATSYHAFKDEQLGSYRPELSGKLNVSAHYLVNRDGTIYQLMPDNWMARHVVGLNHFAIGIENVGGFNDKNDLTQEQVVANAKLVCHLKQKYPTLIYLIGHRDYLQFKNSPYWLEKDESYIPHKPDPGNAFVARVQQLVRPLGLKTSYQA